MRTAPATTGRHARLAATALTLAGLVAGCASAPPASPPVTDLRTQERARVRAEQTEAAQAALASGRLREALWRWRVVEAVADDPATARQQIAQVQAAIAKAATVETARAEAAEADKDPAASQAAYRKAFALDPEQGAAADHLRDIETAAVLKDVSHEQRATSPRLRTHAEGRRTVALGAARKVSPPPKPLSPRPPPPKPNRGP